MSRAASNDSNPPLSPASVLHRISPGAYGARLRAGFSGKHAPVREAVDWDRQDILVCCMIPSIVGRLGVDVLTRIFVLSSIGHLDDSASILVCGVRLGRGFVDNR
jgi:hypothetical protein